MKRIDASSAPVACFRGLDCHPLNSTLPDLHPIAGSVPLGLEVMPGADNNNTNNTLPTSAPFLFKRKDYEQYIDPPAFNWSDYKEVPVRPPGNSNNSTYNEADDCEYYGDCWRFDGSQPADAPFNSTNPDDVPFIPLRGSIGFVLFPGYNDAPSDSGDDYDYSHYYDDYPNYGNDTDISFGNNTQAGSGSDSETR